MKYCILLWYRIMARMVPKSLEWDSPLGSSRRRKEGKRDYYKHTNLANESYGFLKKHCQFGLQSGEYTKVDRSFSPMGLEIGMKICKAIKKMDSIPDLAISNGDFMDGYYTLFYKKVVAGLRCTFELHFHKADLFLYQVSMYEKRDTKRVKTDIDLTELLLGSYLPSTAEDDEGAKHYEDRLGQSICAITDSFNTRFIVTNPNSRSLNQLLGAKYRERVRDYEKIYKGMFLGNA